MGVQVPSPLRVEAGGGGGAASSAASLAGAAALFYAHRGAAGGGFGGLRMLVLGPGGPRVALLPSSSAVSAYYLPSLWPETSLQARADAC